MVPMNPTGKHRPKRRHHGEGTVVQRKDRWRARPWAAVVPYLDESGRRREMWLSAASREEADDLRKRELAKLRKGLVPTSETVGEYVTTWLGTLDVGPGTWPTYRAHVTERIAPTLGAVALDRLTPAMVRQATIRWEGAPATRAGTLRLLRAAMRQAVADRRIEHDPTAGIPYPRSPRKEPVTLTADEARHLMATVKGERFAPILAVSLGLGVRRGEALGLRVGDIHLEGQSGDEPGAPVKTVGDKWGEYHQPGSYVTIAKSLRYIAPYLRAEGEDAYRLTGTKTGDVRTIPLPGFVADALTERLAEREREQRAAKVWAANDLVFCSPVGNSVALETLRTWFHGALERAGLPAIRWHALRASTITVLLDMGVDLLTIQRVVGHKDLATTRRYVGKTPAALASAAGRIEEAMG